MLTQTSGLADWLAQISQLHPSGIELGLERVRQVYWRMPRPLTARVVTVAGTNGKGSTVAMLEAALLQSGIKVGAYTSPHILRFNERIRIHGVDVEDAALVQAFVEVDAARQDIALTYFEFTTLAAFCLLAQAGLDVVVLEVGMGGRLDAVNIIDPDIAIITSIGLDHTDWLGATVELIGREKAGIMRERRPVLLGQGMPDSVFDKAARIHAHVYCFNREFTCHQPILELSFAADKVRFDLPVNSRFPDNNIALAMQAFALLWSLLQRPVDLFAPTMRQILPSILTLPVPGRLEQVSATPEVILDVGHNPHAAQFLEKWLATRKRPGQRCLAVFSALQDKDVDGIVATLKSQIDTWYIAPLTCERAMASDLLRQRVQTQTQNVLSFAHFDAALTQALTQATSDHSLVLVFGSFHVVEQAKTLLEQCPHD